MHLVAECDFAIRQRRLDRQRLRLRAFQRTFGLPADFWTRYRGDIEAITADDLRTASKDLLNQNLQVVVIGRADKLVKALAGKNFSIDVYNTDLQLVSADAQRLEPPARPEAP